LKTYRVKTARERFNYARQYAYCLFEGNFSDLKVLSEEKRGHVLKALSALAKYLGEYQKFQQLVKDYGLKWSGKAKDALLIQRLTKVVDADEIFNWVKMVKVEVPELAVFMDFVAVTGLRLIEAVEAFNLIVRLAKEGKLNEYYNIETNALENYKFRDLFIRRTKKSFVVFVPRALVEKISCSEPLASANAVLKKLQKRGLECRFGDVREAHASFLTKYLNQNEIDFLHGRIGTSVFMHNYFNPALIGDLKDRVFKAIAEIQNKIS